MDTSAIATLLREVAAEVVTPRFRALADGDVSEKAPGDLVTVADREAEVLITRALLDAYPDAVVLGEEAAAQDPALIEAYAAAAHAFVVDPVDGTRNFVHGSPDHAVMAAELRHGVVVRAWIHQPQHDLDYVAERGAGAFRNGEALLVPDAVGDPAAWRGRSARRGWVGHAFTGMPALELSWVSCGVDYPRLIEGGAEYLVYYSTKPWDHAPGQLLLTEAGGTLQTPSGTPYDPRRPFVGGLIGAVRPEVVDVVRGAWSETAGWR